MQVQTYPSSGWMHASAQIRLISSLRHISEDQKCLEKKVCTHIFYH